MIAHLKQLRQQCADTIAQIDAILPDLEALDVHDGAVTFPMIVQGRCTGVTQHTLDRFRERTGSKKSDEHVIQQLRGHVASGEEWELKPKFKIVEMLAHGHHSRFFRHQNMMFVVEDGNLVTMHYGQADRWMPLRTN